MTDKWCNNDYQFVRPTRGDFFEKYFIFILGFPSLTLAWWLFLLKKPHCPICNGDNWGNPPLWQNPYKATKL